MRNQLGQHNVSEKVLRGLWLERLPKSVTQIIALMTRATPLDDLAESADLVFAQSDHGVNAVHTPDTTKRERYKQSATERALADLQRQIREIQISLRPRRRRPYRQKRRRTSSRERRSDQSIFLVSSHVSTISGRADYLHIPTRDDSHHTNWRTPTSNFTKMLSDGIIRPSDSSYASPLHLVLKPGGKEYRICFDYRKLNASTVPDRYPVPHIHDIAFGLQGARIFSKIDLTKAYHQIPVAAEDIHKTAVTTPFGLYEFLKMPFGLRCPDLPTTYGCPARATATPVRSFPATFALRPEPEPGQVHFGGAQYRFLEHHTNTNDIAPMSAKISSIQDFPVSMSIKQLRHFLGMINFYRRLIPNCATIQPLTNRCRERTRASRWREILCTHFTQRRLH
ncbi:unnamed protein product [Acanthosepion pharaonis]|uniref:Reverse transcriptase domain-containing protein n=1 Tax=Acanthosepion pharaonis TaxID=158019 RepID=A0A812D398_ACAPH|nr:unnamed protein product [Sepia pharaonis]